MLSANTDGEILLVTLPLNVLIIYSILYDAPKFDWMESPNHLARNFKFIIISLIAYFKIRGLSTCQQVFRRIIRLRVNKDTVYSFSHIIMIGWPINTTHENCNKTKNRYRVPVFEYLYMAENINPSSNILKNKSILELAKRWYPIKVKFLSDWSHVMDTYQWDPAW